MITQLSSLLVEVCIQIHVSTLTCSTSYIASGLFIRPGMGAPDRCLLVLSLIPSTAPPQALLGHWPKATPGLQQLPKPFSRAGLNLHGL